MSTYWHFVCLDHEPQLSSAEEFTQHTDDIDYANAMSLAMARPLDESWWEGDQGGELGYMERNARRFLQAHPGCRLEAVSEYGDRRDVPSPAALPSAQDQQIGRAPTAAHKQITLLFRALVRSGADASRLNQASDALAQIEALIDIDGTPALAGEDT